MRVVSGQYRGRRLASPEGRDTRPTTEKVREAVFNALGSLDRIVDAEVVDLYAGTGALGLEALSRGAAQCTFVENDRAALEALRHNIEHLGVGDRARVIRGDALTSARTLSGDLLLADPPYGVDPWTELLALTSIDLVVAEAPSAVVAPEGWTELRSRRYGRTWVTFLERE
jgi:16S rRNA (guanine966-N2)-methyltransferase